MVSDRAVTIAALILVVMSSALIGSSSANAEERCKGAIQETVTEKAPQVDIYVKYKFKFVHGSGLLCVDVKNTGEREVYPGFRTAVDGIGIAPNMSTLKPGESVHMKTNVTNYLNVLRDKHTVSVGAHGQNVQFNFTRELNASSPDVPSPYISDVDVRRHEGNSSTALEVDVHNPTKRGYGVHVQAETFGTDGVYRIGAPQENETKTFVLPLEERSDAVVAGKVRVFDDWGEPESKFDQKEFMAKPDEGVNAWDVHFERVPGTVDEYSYSNESARQHRAGYVNDEALGPLERRSGAVLVVAALVGAVAWRRRR